jgi:hypothetical protein
MYTKDTIEIITQRETPKIIGLAPLSFMEVNVSPAPTRNKVKINNCLEI